MNSELLLSCNLLLLLAALPVLPATAYLMLLTVAAFTHPERRQINGRLDLPREPRARFLILIPAHNEELLLGSVLDQLRRISYPAAYFTIVVIADNCEDHTAAVAQQHGAVVLTRTDPLHRGKGQALNWAMQGALKTWPTPYDAVVILDADSIVNDDFLWFMDARLAQGCEALQGYYGVQNPVENWRTSLLTASLAAFHFLRPLGRDRLGLPCGLKGNGICFSRRLVMTYGYPASSVVEDVELALFFLHRGIHVKFVPGAHIFGQMAVSAQAADTQRARWEGGRLALLRAHAWPLLRDGVRRRSAASLDGAVDLLIPPFSLLAAGTLIMTLAAACLSWITHGMLWHILTPLWGAMLASQGVYVLASLILIRAPAIIYRRLLMAPFFVIWKFGVYFRMGLAARRGAPTAWVRTARHEMHDE
jgi:cellulose synthase/poly-beta-1,6-N-acetylglucosamine synthase-like glycosyltransferase